MSKSNGVVALHATEATITTATITIKALKVNSRQLTQAVFKQLPVRKLIDESRPELIGLPWGWVNYQPSGSDECRQFIAQFGATLARCPVRLRRSHEFPGSDSCPPQGYRDTLYPPPQGYRDLRSAYESAAHSRVLASALAGSLTIRSSNDRVLSDTFILPPHPPFGPARVCLRGERLPSGACSGDEEVRAVNDAIRPHPRSYYNREGKYQQLTAEEAGSLARERLWEMLEGRGEDPEFPPADYSDEMDRLAGLAAAYGRRWDDLINTLESVEQLFIAV